MEFEVWMEWRERQWSEPDRRDYYLMQIAHEVTRGYARYPNQVKMEQYKLKFRIVSKDEHEAKGLSDAETSAIMKGKWAALLGIDPKKLQPPKSPPSSPTEYEPTDGSG